MDAGDLAETFARANQDSGYQPRIGAQRVGLGRGCNWVGRGDSVVDGAGACCVPVVHGADGLASGLVLGLRVVRVPPPPRIVAAGNQGSGGDSRANVPRGPGLPVLRFTTGGEFHSCSTFDGCAECLQCIALIVVGLENWIGPTLDESVVAQQVAHIVCCATSCSVLVLAAAAPSPKLRMVSNFLAKVHSSHWLDRGVATVVWLALRNRSLL